MSQFSAFYLEYKQGLLGYLHRLTHDVYLSKDIVQESFTRYLESYGDKSGSSALLYTIARNVLRDNRRNAVRNVEFKENLHSMKTPENNIMARDACRLILSALEELDFSERHLLKLVVSSPLSYRDIAAMTGIRETTLKVKVNRIRAKLKEIAPDAVQKEVYDHHPQGM